MSNTFITECPHCFLQFSSTDTSETIKQHIKKCNYQKPIDKAYPEYIPGENRHIIDDGTDQTYYSRLNSFLKWRSICRDKSASVEDKKNHYDDLMKHINEPDIHSKYDSIYNNIKKNLKKVKKWINIKLKKNV